MEIKTQRNLLAIGLGLLALYTAKIFMENKQLKAGAKSTFDAMKKGTLSYTPQNEKK